MKFQITNQRGSTLLIVLFLVLMLTAVGMMAVDTSNTEIELSFNKVNADKAFYIAEAGAKRAFAELDVNNDWRTGFGKVSFAGGLYAVVVTDSVANAALDDTVLVQSNGFINEALASIELTTVPIYNRPFAYAMFGKSSIDLDRETCTDSFNSDSGSYAATVLDSLGSIGSNGTITSSKDVNFGGDISVATPDGITLGVNNTVNGDTTSTADSVNLDFVPDSEYDWAKAHSSAPGGLSGANYTYDNGTRILTTGSSGNVTLTSGTYYFSSITLAQGSTLSLAAGADVTIYVAGSIILGQGSTVNAGGKPSDLLIYSTGPKLQFDQDNIFVGAYYGPNADIQYDQTTQAFGSLVGDSLMLDKGACFHYDRSLVEITKGKTGDMDMVAWREL